MHERNRLGGMTSVSEQTSKFDGEIKRINELHQQQIGKMKTEAAKVRNALGDSENKIKTLEL